VSSVTVLLAAGPQLTPNHSDDRSQHARYATRHRYLTLIAPIRGFDDVSHVDMECASPRNDAVRQKLFEY
jgi:hypothetical protein